MFKPNVFFIRVKKKKKKKFFLTWWWQTAENVWFKHFNFFFNLLALYIEYILQSEHYGQITFCCLINAMVMNVILLCIFIDRCMKYLMHKIFIFLSYSLNFHNKGGEIFGFKNKEFLDD